MTTSLQQWNNDFSDSDLELLSAYLDDELAAEERAALEQRLEREPALHSELDSLRATTTLLHDLPPMMPPRSFTLDPASVQPRRPSFLSWLDTLPGLGAVATLVLALTFSGVTVIGQGMTLETASSTAPTYHAQEYTPDDAPAMGGEAPAAAMLEAEAPSVEQAAPAAEDAATDMDMAEEAPAPAPTPSPQPTAVAGVAMEEAADEAVAEGEAVEEQEAGEMPVAPPSDTGSSTPYPFAEDEAAVEERLEIMPADEAPAAGVSADGGAVAPHGGGDAPLDTAAAETRDLETLEAPARAADPPAPMLIVPGAGLLLLGLALGGWYIWRRWKNA